MEGNSACGLGTSSEFASHPEIAPLISFGRFTVRNVTVNNAQTGIYMNWNWGMLCPLPSSPHSHFHFFAIVGWTLQGITFRNCQIGFDVRTGGLTLDNQVCLQRTSAYSWAILNVPPIFLSLAAPSPSSTPWRPTPPSSSKPLSQATDASRARSSLTMPSSRTLKSLLELWEEPSFLPEARRPSPHGDRATSIMDLMACSSSSKEIYPLRTRHRACWIVRAESWEGCILSMRITARVTLSVSRTMGRREMASPMIRQP